MTILPDPPQLQPLLQYVRQQSMTKPYPQSHIRNPRWQPSVVVVGDAGVEAAEAAEIEAAAKAAVKAAVRAAVKVALSQPSLKEGSGAQSTLISLKESGGGVLYITVGGVLLIFVQSHPLVRGRISSPRSSLKINETGTSSARNIMTKSECSIAC